jgi:purine-binding chemotaxis protein CheW
MSMEQEKRDEALRRLENDKGGASDIDGIDDMYLTIKISDEEYGVGIGSVTEIVGMQRIMPVPDMPHYIKGVINLRGKVIPLMDARLRFGMAARDYDERTVVIVMDLGESQVGLIVDGVSEVLAIPKSQIDPSNHFRRGGAKSVISGIGKAGDRVCILLDIDVLVSDTDLILPETAKSA